MDQEDNGQPNEEREDKDQLNEETKAVPIEFNPDLSLKSPGQIRDCNTEEWRVASKRYIEDTMPIPFGKISDVDLKRLEIVSEERERLRSSDTLSSQEKQRLKFLDEEHYRLKAIEERGYPPYGKDWYEYLNKQDKDIYRITGSTPMVNLDRSGKEKSVLRTEIEYRWVGWVVTAIVFVALFILIALLSGR